MPELCAIPTELKDSINKFRFRKEKTLGAMLIKINKTKQIVEEEEVWEDTTIEEIANEIPPQQPRYVVISYPLKHDDGRVSYPLLFVYISPEGCSPELLMLYAGTKQDFLVNTGIPKSLELRSLEEFTDECVQATLKKKL